MEHEKPKNPQLKLPGDAFSAAHIRRLRRELEAVEDFLGQAKVREPGKQAELPKSSQLLESLAADNQLNLLKVEDRRELKQFLEAIEHSAPRIHMSFAVPSTQASNRKLAAWLRANIDPYVLLEVGLQPTIAAGCIVRTSNKVFDFSLRHRFEASEGLLAKALEATVTQTAPQAAPAAEAQA